MAESKKKMWPFGCLLNLCHCHAVFRIVLEQMNAFLSRILLRNYRVEEQSWHGTDQCSSRFNDWAQRLNKYENKNQILGNSCIEVMKPNLSWMKLSFTLYTHYRSTPRFGSMSTLVILFTLNPWAQSLDNTLMTHNFTSLFWPRYPSSFLMSLSRTWPRQKEASSASSRYWCLGCSLKRCHGSCIPYQTLTAFALRWKPWTGSHPRSTSR